MVFCQVNQRLVKLVWSLIPDNKKIVDCGCGRALFQSMCDSKSNMVISIDIFPPDDSYAQVYPMDSISFPWYPDLIPMFIRPCHSDFVHRTLCNAFNNGCQKAIYIGLHKNLLVDLRPDEKIYKILPYNKKWKGRDKEKLWEILPVSN